MKYLSSDLLTLRETASILKVHPNTLRLWDKKGILKAIRFGIRKDRRYRHEDIAKIIHSNYKVIKYINLNRK